MKVICEAQIDYNNEIVPGIFDMLIIAPEIAKQAKPGQFINMYCDNKDTILPRPISIANIDANAGTIRVIYAVVGKGTSQFSNLKKGDTIRVMGPLGQGFYIDNSVTEHIIIAGGIGTPPMLELCKNLNGNVSVYLGFRTNPILVEEFKKFGAKVYVATDDGSAGFKGNNIALINSQKPTAQVAYACGPKVMLKAAHNWSQSNNIPLQVSMEERMACGIGACVGCVCKTKSKDGKDFEHTKVCSNGPVFWSDEVIWDE
jgi:dihydroorotate dehydrogenase electron transfer subunit